MTSAAPGSQGGDRGANPFEQDALRWICADTGAASVEGLHQDALERLRSAIDSKLATGGILLLTSPKAGYGKTHLLSRMAAEVQGRATLLSVVLRPGEPVTIAALCQRSLEALQRMSAPTEHWTGLRQVSAEIVSRLVHGLIKGGRLACANQEQALRVLSGPVAEVFSENGRARAIGDWLRQNGEQLSQPLAALATETCSPLRRIPPQWMEALLEQASAGETAGLAMLDELTAGGDAGSWLKLISGTGSLVIALDHVDGFHRDIASAVLIASMIVELAEVYGATVIFSVNQDVWQGAFGSHLPSSLEDRLTGSQIALRGLDGVTAASLVGHRLQSAGIEGDEAADFEKFLAADRFFLGRPVGSVSIRTFLRHAARQWEIFKHSVPSPDEAQDPSPWLPAPEVANEDRSIIPLMPELEGATGRGGTLPAIFDEDTTALVKGIAGGLAGASARTPETISAPSLPPPSPSPTELPPPASEPAQATETVGNVAPTPDAFEKLREMLGKLRQPSAVGEAAAWTPREETPAAFAQSAGPVVATLENEGERTDVLRGRFEALRMQMSAEADSQPLDLGKVTELVRLAGRRFPLVKASEQELPGLNGRQVMCWSLQGVEILFGLAQFSDTAYWKTLGAYAAGRWAEMGENGGTKGCKVKIAAFKTDREQAAYQALLNSGALGESAQSGLDAIHLDTGSIASLYAMQRIVKEAESGALSVEPAQVMSALARELDFFWRRVTRLG